LFVDVVGSTERAASLRDKRWRELLETYNDLVSSTVGRFGGRLVGTEGDGALATFEIPVDAIECARAVRSAAQSIDIDTRAGVHTGEIEIVGDDVAGIGVHIAARVMSAAGAGEVLVSRTVVDLVTGSGIEFDDRGEHDLKGVPGSWQLFAVKA
jgi:class 3 adenylate cyclase